MKSPKVKTIHNLEVKDLQKLLSYDPDTGVFTWKEAPMEMFEDQEFAEAWNKKNAGKEAFTEADKTGQKRAVIYNVTYQAHHVAWALYFKKWAGGAIVNIDGNKGNNKIQNLRLKKAKLEKSNKVEMDVPETAKDFSNMVIGKSSTRPSQRGKYTNNKSGTPGVYLDKNTGKWRAQINVNGKIKSLGYFLEFEDAVTARKQAETTLLVQADPDHLAVKDTNPTAELVVQCVDTGQLVRYNVAVSRNHNTTRDNDTRSDTTTA